MLNRLDVGPRVKTFRMFVGDVRRVTLDKTAYCGINGTSVVSITWETEFTVDLSGDELTGNVGSVFLAPERAGFQYITATTVYANGEASVDTWRLEIIQPDYVNLPLCPILLTPADGALGDGVTTQTVTWATSLFAESYNVYLNGNLVASTTELSYEFTGLDSGETYIWSVNPVGRNGEQTGCASQEFTTAVVPCPVLQQPEDESVSAIDAVLVWASVAGATSYVVYLDGVEVATTSDTTYQLEDLTPSTEYDWTVHAVIDGVESGGCSSFSFTTQAPGCPVLLSPTPGEVTDVDLTLTWEEVVGSTEYRIYVWPSAEAMPGTPTATTDDVTFEYEVTGLDGATEYSWAVHSVIGGVESSGCGSSNFQTAFVCGLPDTGSFLISPAWDSSYPSGTAASAPLTADPITGRIVMVTTFVSDGAGDGVPANAPPAIDLPIVYSEWTHAGQPVDSGTYDLSIVQPPNNGIWSQPSESRPLRRLNVDALPVQFFPTTLFLVNRNGYSTLGSSSWFSAGWANLQSGYIGDIQGYSPVAWSLSGSNGADLEVCRAKYWDGNIYAQSGTSFTAQSRTFYRFSAPGGVLTPIGTAYSGEDMYAGPAATRTFPDTGKTYVDIAYDYSTGKLYVMSRSSSSLYSILIEEIDPLTLATLNTWAKNSYFSDALTGFSAVGDRFVVGHRLSGSEFWVLEKNGSGLDVIHAGINEVATGNGAYIWADPICGWLKQRDRWISSVIGV